MEPPPVQYVKTSDGFDIAYAACGSGRPFVLLPQPISHLQRYWTEQTWVFAWLEGLADRYRLIQYDARGQGLSTRGLPESFSLADLELDLEAVVEAVGVKRFVLMAVHSSGHVALRYAAKHPERVEALVLVSCGLTLIDWYPLILRSLGEQDWDAYLRAQAGLTRASDLAASVQRQRESVSQLDWLLLLSAASESNVADCVPQLRTPTLVLHPRDSLNLPQADSQKLAAAIPNARMTLIDGATPLGDHVQGLKAIDEFIASLPPQEGAPAKAGALSGGLSSREIEVLRLIAAGKSNPQIADELVISINTVQRHVSNILGKTGLANRTEAAGYARDKGLA
jgi:pimeloyl-ACP methyl ester carboxylesterase/DNA-binding CsgD family transcriptional regulator